MKKNKKIILILLLIAILSVFAISISNCTQIIGTDCPDVDESLPHKFWMVNIGSGMINNDQYCPMYTDHPHSSEYAHLYIQPEYESKVDVKNVGDKFDEMYETITDNFGVPVLTSENEYNGKKKVTILLIDIIDGYDGIVNTAYVAGYFYSVDYLSQSSLEDEGYPDKSNEQAILYIDVEQADPESDDIHSTVAHEFQHMINFSENVLDGGNTNATITAITDNPVPTWINEGFSMGAEHIWATDVMDYAEKPKKWSVYNRIVFFNNSDYYVEGNPLIKWMRDNSYETLSNYSSAFLFFQYLRIHSSLGKDVFKTMMDDDDNGVGQITNVLNTVDGSPGNFTALFKNWLQANVLNDESGEYGYGGELGFDKVRAVIGDEEISDKKFHPGAFIYRKNPESKSLTKASSVSQMSFGDGYTVYYYDETNPNGSAVTADVPAGDTVNDATTDKGGFDLNKPMRIDWLPTNPISTYDTDRFRLGQRER